VSYNEFYQTTIGSNFMILQYDYLEPTKAMREVDISTGIELPQTEDAQYKARWCEINKVNIDYVREITYKKNVLRVVTTIPALMSKPVQDKRHEIQIERLVYFPWAPERINGDTRSVVDTIKSLQDSCNRRENMLNNILESSANGGAAVDPAIVDNDPEMKKLIQENWSNPRFKFWTTAGALVSGKNYFAQIPKTVPPNEIFAQINHLWEEIDRVIPVNAAADGRTQSNSESGILFSMKQNAIETAQTTLVRGIMASLTEMGEAYFRAAKSYYSNVERTFLKPDGSTFKINEIIPLPSGDVGMKNDVSGLQNLKTLVKMGPDSPNTRFTRRLTALDVLKLIPPNYATLQVEVISELMDTLDLDEDYKQRIMGAITRAREVATAMEDQVKAVSATAQAQAGQAMNPPQPQQPAGTPPGGTPEGQPNPSPSPLEQALAPLARKG
jgi:hypothetical protein